MRLTKIKSPIFNRGTFLFDQQDFPLLLHNFHGHCIRLPVNCSTQRLSYIANGHQGPIVAYLRRDVQARLRFYLPYAQEEFFTVQGDLDCFGFPAQSTKAPILSATNLIGTMVRLLISAGGTSISVVLPLTLAVVLPIARLISSFCSLFITV